MQHLSWYALRVRTGRESAIRSLLESRGYNTLLPSYQRYDKPSSAQEAWRPLFPGYLFCQFDETISFKLIVTPGVLSVVTYGKQWVSVDEDEIRSLQHLVSSDLPRCPWLYTPNGCRIRIENGPLKSAIGILVDRSRLAVSITLLGRSTAVELPGTTIFSVIEPPKRPPDLDRLQNIALHLARSYISANSGE